MLPLKGSGNRRAGGFEGNEISGIRGCGSGQREDLGTKSS